MPSDQGPTDPRRDARSRDDWDADDGLGPVHEQRPASDYYDDDPYDDYDDGPRLLARRLVQGGVALLAVVLFLGVVWYAYTWGSRSAATGEVPVVSAPEGTEKVEPDDPGGMDVPHQDKLVLNQDGEDGSGQVERLLPPPEEPRPPESRQPDQTGEPQPEQGTATTSGEAQGEQVADLPKTTVPDQDMPEGEQGAGAVDSDGTGDSAAADGGAQAGDEQAGAASETQTAAAPTRTPERKPGGDEEGASSTSETAAADPAQPATEPSDQPSSAPDDGRFAVQIAAFQSEQAARNAWSTYQERFPEILSGQRLLLQNAEVDGQMYWRVRTGPFADRASAQAVCDRLKARDQSCLPVTR